MLEGMYTAAAGMAAQQSGLDAVANDLANASTTGYKRVRMAYREEIWAAVTAENAEAAKAPAQLPDMPAPASSSPSSI